ncbi:unnamed protein product [Heligmosomoides polygyrus]|uniref:Secreted protein n=1 Tax=Heligmosomoides polygyrus TaxID=6339 RepID=A0A183G6Y7_HELPZ|nr:unnamed protein product [Heligmosomoides polygyrus]
MIMRLSAAWLAILRLCALANAEDKETVKPQGSKLSSWLKDENKFRYDVECNWLRSDERAHTTAIKHKAKLVASLVTTAADETEEEGTFQRQNQASPHERIFSRHGCRRLRHVYGSPCTVADMFCSSTASPGA